METDNLRRVLVSGQLQNVREFQGSSGSKGKDRGSAAMIHVSISIEYRSIPFCIEVDAQTPASFDVGVLGALLDRIKSFIDKMLEAKQ